MTYRSKTVVLLIAYGILLLLGIRLFGVGVTPFAWLVFMLGLCGAKWIGMERRSPSQVTLWDPNVLDSTTLSHLEIFKNSRWQPYVAERLIAIQSSGASSLSFEELSEIWSLLRRTLPISAPTPSVTPANSRSIHLFWHKKGWVIEVMVGVCNECSVSIHSASDYGSYGTLESQRGTLVRLLNELS